MKPSDHYNGKIFLNPVPTHVMGPGSFFKVFREYLKPNPGREPAKPLGPFSVDDSFFRDAASEALRITWLGHSTTLIAIDGKRFLTDPVWYNRVSPFSRIGPKRFFQNPADLASLPPVDAVLLSHDHYDHFDKQTLLYLAGKGIPVITMLGVGERLRGWGVPHQLVTELDWWEETTVGGIRITAAPARHFSGRWLADRFRTLWGSFAVKGPTHNLYFGADSGYYNGFKAIAEKLGPFDLAMLEIGAYNENWADIHMGPDGAAQAIQDMGKPLTMPLHWGTFNLALHPWKEPVERLLAYADRFAFPLLLPSPGETLSVNGEPYVNKWWEKCE